MPRPSNRVARQLILVRPSGRSSSTPDHPQGGPAATSNPFRIQAFNVVLKRGPVESLYDGGIYGLVAEAFVQHNKIKVASNRDIVAIQYSEPAALEALVSHLIASGLSMTRDEMFSDFAIVHGKHGVPMPCEWLEYTTDGDGAMIRLKPQDDVFDLSLAGDGYEGPGWITARGHGFIISQEDDYDVWLDFATGETVVSLRAPNLFRP